MIKLAEVGEEAVVVNPFSGRFNQEFVVQEYFWEPSENQIMYVFLNEEKSAVYVKSKDCTVKDASHTSVWLTDLGIQMTAWMYGLGTREDNLKLAEVFTMLWAIQYEKEGHYGSSWKGKGEYRGIVANLDRKYDRLDKITNDEIAGLRDRLPTLEFAELTSEDIAQIGESKIDAIADLANYCLLYMTYMRDNFPGAFRIWVDKNIPVYLQERIPFIQK